MKSTCLILLSVFSPAAAFVSPAPLSRSSATTSLSAQKSRTEFLRDAAGLGIAAAAAAAATGGSVLGELATIRFSAYAGVVKIDDIFDTPEPYFTRVGSGGLIKGVEEVLPMMRVGDRWVLTIPVSGGHRYCVRQPRCKFSLLNSECSFDF